MNPSVNAFIGKFEENVSELKPESHHLVFLDFPYGETDKQACTDPNQGYKNMQVNWDYSRDETYLLLQKARNEAWRILKPGGWCILTATPYAKPLVWDLFGFNGRAKGVTKFIVRPGDPSGHKEAVPDFRFQNEVIWCKPNASPGTHAATNKFLIKAQESVFFYAKGFPKTFNYQWLKTHKTPMECLINSSESYPRDFWIINVENGPERFHEAQKPEKLLERVMGGWTNEGDHVADFFMGSGTSGISLMFGCNYTGFEQEERYFTPATERLARWHRRAMSGERYR